MASDCMMNVLYQIYMIYFSEEKKIIVLSALSVARSFDVGEKHFSESFVDVF
jgi:hypothetical protein